MSTGLDTTLSFDQEEPDFTDVFKAAARTTLLDLRVAFPATVSKVGDGGKTVDVQADQQNVAITEGTEQVQPLLEIFSLPVLVYGRGATGGGYLQFPIQVGDKGLVIVNDRSLNDWYKNGTPGPPPHYHAHNVTDGVFFPGLRDSTRGQSQDSDGTAVLESDNIKLGENALLDAARKTDKTKSDISMSIWITSVISALATLKPPIIVAPPTDFGVIDGGSTKVTIE